MTAGDFRMRDETMTTDQELGGRITGADYRIEPDERDREILAKSVEARAAIHGPRVGDFFEYEPGKFSRFTYHHGDVIQTTWPKFGEGSFYLTSFGRLSYSGSLDSGVPAAHLVDTGWVRFGRVWFFHHGYSQAHSAVYALIPCRVYRLA